MPPTRRVSRAPRRRRPRIRSFASTPYTAAVAGRSASTRGASPFSRMNAAELLLGPAALQRHGARCALVCNGESVSYAELAARVTRASAALAALGVRPGDRVLLLMRDTPEFAAAWLGAVRAGAVDVALNNKLSEAEYSHILDARGARIADIMVVFAAV